MNAVDLHFTITQFAQCEIHTVLDEAVPNQFLP